MDAKDRIIQELRELVEELRREIEELKLALAKANKDSSNSSKSPSSDIVKPPKRDAQGKPAGKKRKRGRQPGRKRKLRYPSPGCSPATAPRCAAKWLKRNFTAEVLKSRAIEG